MASENSFVDLCQQKVTVGGKPAMWCAHPKDEHNGGTCRICAGVNLHPSQHAFTRGLAAEPTS